MVTCWEKAGLFALLCVILCFCSFTTCCPGLGMVLDCIDSLTLLLYFVNQLKKQLWPQHLNAKLLILQLCNLSLSLKIQHTSLASSGTALTSM